MRRRLLTGFFLLDGLCALALPVVAPTLLAAPQAEAAYVEIAGMCVQETASPDDGLGGRPVPMSLCTDA